MRVDREGQGCRRAHPSDFQKSSRGCEISGYKYTLDRGRDEYLIHGILEPGVHFQTRSYQGRRSNSWSRITGADGTAERFISNRRTNGSAVSLRYRSWTPDRHNDENAPLLIGRTSVVSGESTMNLTVERIAESSGSTIREADDTFRARRGRAQEWNVPEGSVQQ